MKYFQLQGKDGDIFKEIRILTGVSKPLLHIIHYRNSNTLLHIIHYRNSNILMESK